MKVSIKYNKKVNLSARLRRVSDDTSIVLLVHGFSIDKDTEPFPTLEEKLNKIGVNTLNIDLYGHGESGGRFQDITITKGVESILCAVDFLKKEGYEQIGVVAESFGGQCSILAAADLNISFLVLKSPVSDYVALEKRRRTKEVLSNWRKNDLLEFTNGFGVRKKLRYLFHKDVHKHAPYKAAEEIECPTLILHGKLDKAVSHKQSQKLNKHINSSELKLFPNSNHKIHLNEEAEEMYEIICNFIEKKADLRN